MRPQKADVALPQLLVTAAQAASRAHHLCAMRYPPVRVLSMVISAGTASNGDKCHHGWLVGSLLESLGFDVGWAPRLDNITRQSRGGIRVSSNRVGRASNAQTGQGMVEYALILVLVSIVVIVVLLTMGNQIANVFSNIVAALG